LESIENWELKTKQSRNGKGTCQKQGLIS